MHDDVRAQNLGVHDVRSAYDFVNCFECADADIETFHEVCANLRDVTKNPEWRFVREGPTWHGRRVRHWAELFD